MRLKMLPLVIFLGLLSINQARALYGGHWVFDGYTTFSNKITLTSIHEGDAPKNSSAIDADDEVIFREPEKNQWDSSCLQFSGNLTYFVHHESGHYASNYAWSINAEMITNPAENKSGSGYDYGPWHPWAIDGVLTVINTCSEPKVFDIERNTDLGGIYQAIIVKGSVGAKASCTLSLSSPVVDLGKIYASDLMSAQVGTNLEGKDGSVEVTTKCNQSAYKLTFKPEHTGGACVGSDNSVLRYCLKAQDKTLDMSGGSATYSGRQADGSGGIGTQLTITPQRGAGTPTAGVSSGKVTITVSPE